MKYGDLDKPEDLGEAARRMAIQAVDDVATNTTRTGEELMRLCLPGWRYRGGHPDIMKRIYTMHKHVIADDQRTKQLRAAAWLAQSGKE